jgi:hypothetical protein
MVVRALAHESIRTTREHYTQPHAVANARQKRVLQVIQGGERKKVAAGNNDWSGIVVTGEPVDSK